MTKYFLFFLLITGSNLWAQDYYLIKTGRPRPLEYNVAESIVAKDYSNDKSCPVKIKVLYHLYSPEVMLQYDSINESSEQQLIACYGVSWRDQFNEKIAAQLEVNTRIVNWYKGRVKDIHKGENLYQIERSGKRINGKYTLIVFRLDQGGQENKYRKISVCKVNVNRKRIRFLKVKTTTLGFSYPENDID